MFNLTDYVSNLFVNDPLMLMFQFVIMPFAMLGFFTWLYYWKAERNKRQWVNSE